MKKMILTVITAVMVVCAMLAASMQTSYAADEPSAIQDIYTIDGVTYYNTGSNSFSSNANQYLKEVLGNGSSVLAWKEYNRSTADLWLEAAAGLMQGKGGYLEDGRFAVAIDLGACQSSQSQSYNIGNEYINISRYPTSGMRSDDMASLKSAEQYVYRVAGITKDPAKTGHFKDRDEKHTVVAAALKSYKSSSDFRVAAVYFSNFRIVALFPEDVGNNYVTTILNETTNYSKAAASSVRNNTGTTATGSQKISNSYSASLSSSVSGSKTYTYQEGIKVGNKFGSGFFNELSVDLSFTASQAVQKGWSKSESESESNGFEQSLSISLPPFTNVMMTQKTTEAEKLIRYNCPVGITFDATIVIYDPNGIHTFNGSPLVFNFENSARTALGNRFEEWNGEHGYADSDGILWYYVTAFDGNGETDTHIEEAIRKAAGYVPMAPTGAEFRTKLTMVSGEIDGIMPIYPLAKIGVDSLNIPRYEDYGSYNNYNYLSMKMPVGDYTYANYFSLSASNQYNSPYYGFNKYQGGWKVVDGSGEEWTGSDAPVVVEKDKVSGYSLIKAVRPGTCYLKYYINEDVYNTSVNPDYFTKNSELKATAVVRVTVTDTRSVSVSGSYEGFVGEEPEELDADEKLYAFVSDSTGVEIDAEVTWEKKEKKNILLDGNKVSFTKPGTYHVRACVDGIKSDWVPITAKYRTYDVTFKMQSGAEDRIVTVRKGQTVSAPEVTLGTCEAFSGWYTNKKCTKLYAFDTAVTADLVLYGGFKPTHTWDTDYTVDKAATYTSAGSKSIHCTVCGSIKEGSAAEIPKLVKKTNSLSIKAKTATVKYDTLKTKSLTLAVTKVIEFTKKGQGKMIYVKKAGNEKISIDRSTGKVTVGKGLKKGTYKVKVSTKATGNDTYKASSVKTVIIVIKVA